MRSSCSGLAAVLVLFFCLFPPAVRAASDGTAPPYRGTADDVLVYERHGWIWTCDGDGKGERRLVQGVRPEVDARGRLIAFFRPTRGDASGDMSDLWVYDLERGSEAMVLVSFFAASSPMWSADAKSIAFLVRDAESLTSLIVVKADGGAVRTVLREGEGGTGFLCALSATPEGALLTHDMVNAYWVNPDGGVLKAVALTKIMGSKAESITSSDKLAVCPTDPAVLVFSHSIPGTPRFEKVMHEPSSALSLHDSWVGVGKNMRITPHEITAYDPVWSGDGRRIYFIGYKDTQAADADLFRVLRIDRFGSGLKELVLGESVSVGVRAAAGQ